MNRVIANLERELASHQIRIYKQEMKVEAETAKLAMLKDFQERWGAQLEKLKAEEEERHAKMRGANR